MSQLKIAPWKMPYYVIFFTNYCMNFFFNTAISLFRCIVHKNDIELKQLKTQFFCSWLPSLPPLQQGITTALLTSFYNHNYTFFDILSSIIYKIFEQQWMVGLWMHVFDFLFCHKFVKLWSVYRKENQWFCLVALVYSYNEMSV